MKLHLVMPMGGRGTRFGTAGAAVPKPLIELYGAPFFYWATQSVAKFTELASLTFVVLQEHIERYDIGERIAALYPDARLVVLPEVLPGAVMTCLAGVQDLPAGEPVLFNDCDHLFLCRAFTDFCREERFDQLDGALLTFQSSDSRFSYAAHDAAGYVVRTMEKQAISEDAICGAYYLRNREIFERAVETYLNSCSYSEFFMSGIYNVLVGQGLKVGTFRVDRHVSFGTPQEMEEAEHDQTHCLLW